MIKKLFSFFVFLAVFIALLFFFGKEQFSDSVQEKFSLKDKLGQMLIIGFDGTEFSPEIESLLRDVRPGGVLLLERNIKSQGQLRKLTSALQSFALKEIGRPLFIAVDQEGGEISRIPWVEAASQAGLFDREEGYAIGQKRARELEEMGVNMNLAPVADSAGKGDFIYGRSFQKSPSEAFPVLLGLVEGHESKGVIAVPKHFPGYGGIAVNPESAQVPRVQSVPDISLFVKLFKEHPVPFLMVSHVVYEDLDKERPFPFSGMKFERETFGNEALMMSDDLLSPAFLSQYGLQSIGVQALQGGINVLLVAGYPDAKLVPEFFGELWKGVQEHKELHPFIEFSAERIIEAKRALH